MLVVLNPASEDVAAQPAISLPALLQQDPELGNVIQDYVVAQIDTGTEHGRKVYELFGSPVLPRIVVIDDHQAKQVFRTSSTLPASTLRDILVQYKDGAATTVAAETSMQSFIQGNCPSCQQRVMRPTF